MMRPSKASPTSGEGARLSTCTRAPRTNAARALLWHDQQRTRIEADHLGGARRRLLGIDQAARTDRRPDAAGMQDLAVRTHDAAIPADGIARESVTDARVHRRAEAFCRDHVVCRLPPAPSVKPSAARTAASRGVDRRIPVHLVDRVAARRDQFDDGPAARDLGVSEQMGVLDQRIGRQQGMIVGMEPDHDALMGGAGAAGFGDEAIDQRLHAFGPQRDLEGHDMTGENEAELRHQLCQRRLLLRQGRDELLPGAVESRDGQRHRRVMRRLRRLSRPFGLVSPCARPSASALRAAGLPRARSVPRHRPRSARGPRRAAAARGRPWHRFETSVTITKLKDCRRHWGLSRHALQQKRDTELQQRLQQGEGGAREDGDRQGAQQPDDRRGECEAQRLVGGGP